MVEVTGPAITLTETSATIAAIETAMSQAPYDAGNPGVCEVKWNVPTINEHAWGAPMCPALPFDAGVDTAACPKHFECPRLSGCNKAWIQMTADSCLVTVIAATGERQDVRVNRSSDPIRASCHVGCSDTWTEVLIYPGIPKSVTLTFSPADGGAALDTPSGE
jgi:hypothetical protein